MTDPQPDGDAATAPSEGDDRDKTGHDPAGALDADRSADGLAHLVLSLVQLLHDLLEKQAIRRMESGRLTDAEVERVGQTLMRQAEEIDELCEVFGLDPDDLDLPIGSVQVSDGFERNTPSDE